MITRLVSRSARRFAQRLLCRGQVLIISALLVSSCGSKIPQERADGSNEPLEPMIDPRDVVVKSSDRTNLRKVSDTAETMKKATDSPKSPVGNVVGPGSRLLAQASEPKSAATDDEVDSDPPAPIKVIKLTPGDKPNWSPAAKTETSKPTVKTESPKPIDDILSGPAKPTKSAEVAKRPTENKPIVDIDDELDSPPPVKKVSPTATITDIRRPPTKTETVVKTAVAAPFDSETSIRRVVPSEADEFDGSNYEPRSLIHSVWKTVGAIASSDERRRILSSGNAEPLTPGVTGEFATREPTKPAKEATLDPLLERPKPAATSDAPRVAERTLVERTVVEPPSLRTSLRPESIVQLDDQADGRVADVIEAPTPIKPTESLERIRKVEPEPERRVEPVRTIEAPVNSASSATDPAGYSLRTYDVSALIDDELPDFSRGLSLPDVRFIDDDRAHVEARRGELPNGEADRTRVGRRAVDTAGPQRWFEIPRPPARSNGKTDDGDEPSQPGERPNRPRQVVEQSDSAIRRASVDVEIDPVEGVTRAGDERENDERVTARAEFVGSNREPDGVGAEPGLQTRTKVDSRVERTHQSRRAAVRRRSAPVDELIAAIVETIDPNSWSHRFGFGRVALAGDKLLVHQTERNHRAIGELIEATMKLRPARTPIRIRMIWLLVDERKAARYRIGVSPAKSDFESDSAGSSLFHNEVNGFVEQPVHLATGDETMVKAGAAHVVGRSAFAERAKIENLQLGTSVDVSIRMTPGDDKAVVDFEAGFADVDPGIRRESIVKDQLREEQIVSNRYGGAVRTPIGKLTCIGRMTMRPNDTPESPQSLVLLIQLIP